MFRKLIILFSLLLFSVVSAEAQNRTDKSRVQQRKQETTKRLKQSTRDFEKNKAETAKKLKELSLVEGEIELTVKEINQKQKSVDSLQTIIESVTDTIEGLNSRLTDLSDKYAAALKQKQGNYQSPSTISFLFSSKSVSQALRRYRALKQFSKWRARKADEIQSIKGRLEERKSELKDNVDKQSTLLDRLSKQKDELTANRNKNRQIVDGLKKKGKEIKSVIDDSQKELQQLEKQLEKIIAEEQRRLEEERRREEERRKAEEARLAEERRKAEEERLAEEKRKAEADKKNNKADNKKKKDDNKKNKSGDKNKKSGDKSAVDKTQATAVSNDKGASTIGSVTSRTATQLSAGFRSAKGNLPYPVDGRYIIVRGFGRQKHPDLPMIETDNPGIDISVQNGEKARSVYEGVVSAIFKQPGFNNVIMVRHGDYLTIYANLDNIEVKKGDRIGAGQPLGRVAKDEDDSKGRSILHFEIRHEKEKENPSLWLK